MAGPRDLFFNKFIYLSIYFWLRWVFIAAHGLSLVAASGATLRCGARASHGGFLLRSTGSRKQQVLEIYYFFNFNFLMNLFIYLFMAALGLRCCMQDFFSCVELGLLFIAVSGLLIAVASLVAEHGL